MKQRKLPDLSHGKWLLWWPIYFLLYWLTESRIPPQRMHLIHCALDERIPFLEVFAIFYVGWYFLILGSLLYFLFRDASAFRKLQMYIMLLQILATIVFVVYPSYHTLRPQQFPRENAFAKIMGWIYGIDTPTGIFPSLHVAISVAIASLWLRQKSVSLWIRCGICLFCALVILSVVFVKQHSVLDILGAIPICLLAERLVFHSGGGG